MEEEFVSFLIRFIFGIIRFIIIFYLIYNSTGWNGFVVFIIASIFLSIFDFIWAWIKTLFGIF